MTFLYSAEFEENGSKINAFEDEVNRMVVSFYENPEVSNKKQAIRTLKNIIFVYIDEIEEGNINTFSPHETGVMPTSHSQWGIYPSQEDNQQHVSNCENLFLTFNQKAIEIMNMISCLTSKHFFNGKNNSLKKILKKINDFTSEISPHSISGIPLCRYGRECFRHQNRIHTSEYAHPWFLSSTTV